MTVFSPYFFQIKAVRPAASLAFRLDFGLFIHKIRGRIRVPARWPQSGKGKILDYVAFSTSRFTKGLKIVSIRFVASSFLFFVTSNHPLVIHGFQTEDSIRLQNQMTQQIQPLIETYCADCHSGADAEGGLDLDRYQLLKDLLADSKRWQRLKDRVRRGQMPPPDADPLPEQEKKTLAQLDRCQSKFTRLHRRQSGKRYDSQTQSRRISKYH